MNTFAIGGIGGSASTADLNVITAALVGFYNADLTGGTASLGAFLSPIVDRSANACSIKLYDISAHLDGSPHGSPIHETLFTLDAAAGTVGMPEEVAICLTLEAANRASQQVERADGADPGTAVDRPRQRYTGRVYLGPWVNAADIFDTGAAGQCLVDSALPNRLATNAMATFDSLETTLPGAWFGVWSRADARIRSIDAVSCDNAFDTIRSRGVTSSSRTRVSTPPIAPNVELAA